VRIPLCIFVLTVSAFAATPITTTTVVNQSVTLVLSAGKSAPKLVSVQGAQGSLWRNADEEPLISSIEVGGENVPLHWRFVRSEAESKTQVSFLYESSEPHLKLTWEWRARAATGPVEHTIRIENLTGREILLPIQTSIHGRFPIEASEPLSHMYIEKGADSPSAEGTHLVRMRTNYEWIGESSTYAHPVPGHAREIIPWSSIERDDRSGFYVGIEFSGRTAIHLQRETDGLVLSAGLNADPSPARIRLRPRETFETPTVFLGAYSGGPDGAGNQLRRWVRDVLGNPRASSDPHYPFTVSNSWGAGMAVDEPLACRMIKDAANLGLEMFHLDAGWFRAVGDWHPDPMKFPRGLKPVAEEAHRRGMKFGLWTDWAQAGTSLEPGALNVHDPAVKDWLVSELPPGWKPEGFKGQTVDIGVAAAERWVTNETDRLVNDFHLDMFEHDGYLVAQGCVHGDHPHTPPDPQHIEIQRDAGFRFVYSANSADVSYRATRAYYRVQENLRREHPDLLLEICNDGGRMVDFGSAAHGDYFSITDTYDPLSNRRAFYDASYLLPPAMLESYVERWETPRIENFLYMLRSGMMGWFSLMQDSSQWSDEQRQRAKDEIAFYKSELRPLIRDAELYHVGPRPDGVHWDGVEYFDPARRLGTIYAFRGSAPGDATHLFRLAGLRRDRGYALHFRGASSPDGQTRGSELMDTGVSVKLANPNSSEIVLIRELPD
jgi:hypothetical protein